MDDWELRARIEITDMLSSYTRFGDGGRSADLARLFGSDGVLSVAGGQELHGSGEIEAFLEDAKRALAARAHPGGRFRHHVSSQWVELIGPTEAKARSYFLVMGPTGPDHWGTYTDRIVTSADGWLFAERAVRVEGRAPGSPADVPE